MNKNLGMVVSDYRPSYTGNKNKKIKAQACPVQIWEPIQKQQKQEQPVHGSSGRTPAWQAQGPEFNSQYHTNLKK
jgi:hypothetical protein